MAILLTPTTGLVLAQSNHTLEWGVDVGEEFTYVLQREFYADISNEIFLAVQLPFLTGIEAGQKVQLQVDQLDTIENMINNSLQLPRSLCTMVRENDSTTILSEIPSFVVPTGDWDFLDEIENLTGTEGLTLIDTDDEWGTIGTGTVLGTGGASINVRIEMRYEKENGTLNYLRHKYTTLGNDLIDVIFVHWYPGMPTIIGGGIQTTTLMIIAVSGVMGLIVAFIVYRGIKGKKLMIQRLGE